MAVVVGLVVGKPLGVFGGSWIAVRFGWAQLPDQTSWTAVLGAAFLSGIGFTMALFVASLGLTEAALDAAKTGVLMGSGACMLIGMWVLRFLAAPTGPCT